MTTAKGDQCRADCNCQACKIKRAQKNYEQLIYRLREVPRNAPDP